MKHAAVFVVMGVVVLLQPAPAPAETEHSPEVLERYYQCLERHDLDLVRDLIWYHHNVERVDASVYGLPPDDFDDRQALSIQERLDFRAAKAALGVPLATSGPIQYPHHLRHSLNVYYRVEGIRPDCSAILADAGTAPPELEGLSVGWLSDLNLTAHDGYERGEVHVAVDQASPNRLLVTSVPSGYAAEYSSFRAASTDYGQTWSRGQVGRNAGTTWECDPVSYYQRSTGNVYHAKLACSNWQCSQTYTMMRRSTDNGITWVDCGRPGNQTDEDREWITVDNVPGSPCYGTIYATWHNLNQKKVTASGDNCATFGTPSSLTGLYSAITPDVATAADGRAYVLWHHYASSDPSFKVRGSTDCGAVWFSPNTRTVKTKYANVGATAAAQCDRGVSNQVAIGVDVAPNSAFYGRVYAVMFDMNQDGCWTASRWTCAQWDANWSSTCNWDVWLAYSDDNADTWSPAVNLTAHEGNTVDHFLGFMRVDPADGSVYVGYHRSRLNPTSAVDRQKTHYFVVRSTDGGASFEPAVQASTVEGDERSSGYATGWERGDYQGVDVYEGVAWPVWVDRRGDNVPGGEEEIVTRKLCSEPSHWSERAPTFATPAVAAVGFAPVTVSWDPPDLYWGDGGENPAARKYQLWVDGALVEDDIPGSATWTTYVPGDELGHTYVVRAVNQCGVAKDYAGVTHGSGIFADDFETGDTDNWSHTAP